MEQRNQLRVFSATVVLRAGKRVVVDWEADRINRDSIVVLDSVSECSDRRNDSLAGLRHCEHGCAAAGGSANRGAAASCFPSSECVLRNEQRRPVACLLRRAVPLRFAMVANECAELFVWSVHRSGDRRDLPHQDVERAAGRSRRCNYYCQSCGDYPTSTSRRAVRACRDCVVCRDSHWQLDALDKVSFRRSDRIDSQNCFAWLDAKTVWRLVAPSDFHAARFMGFLVGLNRELLARRSQLARSAVALACCRWILRYFDVGSCRCGDPRLTEAGRTYRFPATSDWKCNLDFRSGHCLSGPALDPIRFRQLH